MDSTDYGKLPIGFAMALAQNQAALEIFGTMPKEEKQIILDRAHGVRSEEEMHQLVSGLAAEH